MYCNVSKHPHFLTIAWRTIARRFVLPLDDIPMPPSL
jgi:hypothetical protein